MSDPPVVTYTIVGSAVRLLLGQEQTKGQYCMVHNDVPPGGGFPPLHAHEAWDEWFYTAEGELTYFRDNGPGGAIVEIAGGVGTWTYVPGGVAHTFRGRDGWISRRGLERRTTHWSAG